ncbi:ABC transporter substrate-binding protein [Enterovirga sp. CN4-39]|uniref:ABC transporter substrate-binding protein n=1 Tax=Enterovirga sp. CN4-39 TaxID=3400910 RepID=UPI003C10D89F
MSVQRSRNLRLASDQCRARTSLVSQWQRTIGAVALLLGALTSLPVIAQEKTVYLQKNTDARSFDPHKIISRSVGEILPFMLDTLVTVEDDLATIRPGLAEKWTVSPDGLTYSFALKQGLRFCDGRTLTADDVSATFLRWLDPATKSTNTVLLGPLSSVTAKDHSIVEFKLREPYADFLIQLASPYAGIIDAAEAKRLGDAFAVQTMNGTGPYCWKHWRPRDEIAMTRNPHYTWGAGPYDTKGPARVAGVVFKIMPEDNSRVAALLTGQSDASYYVPWSSIAEIRKDSRFEVSQPRAFGWIAFLGTKLHRPMMEPAVRKAMNLAIDREAIVEALYAGEADPARSAVSPRFNGYNKALEARLPRFDQAAARKILDDAGWRPGSDGIRAKNGVKLAPVLVGYNTWRERLEAVQGMLAEIGVDLKLELADTPVAVARMLSKDDFDLFGYFGSYSTVGEVLQKYFLPTEPVSPFFFAKEQGVEVATLITAGRRELDPAKRTEYFDRAQELVADGSFWVPLTHERMLVVSNKTRVTGLKPHGLAGNGLYKGLDFAPAR